jgi:hypothetical protein
LFKVKTRFAYVTSALAAAPSSLGAISDNIPPDTPSFSGATPDRVPSTSEREIDGF